MITPMKPSQHPCQRYLLVVALFWQLGAGLHSQTVLDFTPPFDGFPITNGHTVTSDGITITFSKVVDFLGNDGIYTDSAGIALSRNEGGDGIQFDITFSRDLYLTHYTIGFVEPGTTEVGFTISSDEGSTEVNPVHQLGTFPISSGSIEYFRANTPYTFTHNLAASDYVHLKSFTVLEKDPTPAADWTYNNHYPWIYSVQNGWLFYRPSDEGLWTFIVRENRWILKK